MRYMLDTNICIHLIHDHPRNLVERFEELTYGDACLSSVVLAELRYGVEKKPEIRSRSLSALNAMLSFFPVLSFDTAAAESYGVLRMASPDRRRDALDRLIAAHALSRDLVLVTNNTRDFEGYPGLIVENWIRTEESPGTDR